MESKLTVCDKIEETISQSLLQAETMKQIILKKAFEGKLVEFQQITETIICDGNKKYDIVVSALDIAVE